MDDLTVVPNPFVVVSEDNQPSSSKSPRPVEPGSDSASSSDEDSNDVYMPGLVLPSLFLPIPASDSVSTLLARHVPEPAERIPRDTSGDWRGQDFHNLVVSNSWRALATLARDRIVSADPRDLNLVLSLWHLRLASLARLRLFNQTAAELANLFSVLDAVHDPNARARLFDTIVPFELLVLQTRAHYWAGDPYAYLDALTALLRRCKRAARAVIPADESAQNMWRERGARLTLILASQLVEMRDYMQAARLLDSLQAQPEGASGALHASIGRLYLQAGGVQRAQYHFERVRVIETEPGNLSSSADDESEGLMASARGDWKVASVAFAKALESDPANVVAANDLAVSLLSQGAIGRAIATLEESLRTSPAAVTAAEPVLFNLSTLYELRSSAALHKKRSLLLEVAKWSGDGLKTSCLKMPAI